MKIEQTVAIEAAVGSVWQFITDPANLPKWNRKVVAIRTLGSLRRTGDQFRVTYRLGTRETELVAHVTEFSENRRLEVAMASEKTDAQRITETFVLEPRGSSVLLTHSVVVANTRIPWWARTLIAFLERFGSRQGTEPLETLKRLVEESGAWEGTGHEGQRRIT